MPSIKDRTFGEHNYINSCTGCGACQNMCPCGAIEMCVDSIEGYKPFVVKSICIDCGRCIDVCPVLNEEKNLHFIYRRHHRHGTHRQRLCAEKRLLS